MRERITIQKLEFVVDETGNHKNKWKDYFKCYAYVNNLSGKEYYQAAQINAQHEIYFVIRYCSELKDIDCNHYRIVFRNQPYNITFVDNVKYKNQTIKLRAGKVKR
jgi:SPP1 family predicted phage head-tail adaptor